MHPRQVRHEVLPRPSLLQVRRGFSRRFENEAPKTLLGRPAAHQATDRRRSGSCRAGTAALGPVDGSANAGARVGRPAAGRDPG